jgi:type II secretion system protein G
MVDYSALRKKFPVKDAGKKRSIAARKAIAQEYERKRAALGAGAPVLKKGLAFYAVVVIGLALLGSLVLSATGRGGRARIDRAELTARKAVDALATALGRWRYHVGTYPSTEEGLAALASVTVAKKGWNGPYVRRIVPDPWGNDYVYVRNAEGETPTLFSKGPDGRMGTGDDILPSPELFEAPLRDVSWTRGWMPRQLRGYVLARDEEDRKNIERQVEDVWRETAEEKPLPRLDRDGAAWKETLAEWAAVSTTDGWRRYDPACVEKDGHFVWIVSTWSAGRENEGRDVPVSCRTSGDEIELFVNGESAGRRRAPFEWTVAYEPGEIKAIAYKDGRPLCESVRTTAWDPVYVSFAGKDGLVDEAGLADGACAVLAVVLTDEKGRWAVASGTPVDVTVSGPGELVSVDPSVPPAARGTVRLSEGRAAVVVRRTGASALPVRVVASSPGLREATLVLPRR